MRARIPKANPKAFLGCRRDKTVQIMSDLEELQKKKEELEIEVNRIKHEKNLMTRIQQLEQEKNQMNEGLVTKVAKKLFKKLF